MKSFAVVVCWNIVDADSNVSLLVDDNGLRLTVALQPDNETGSRAVYVVACRLSTLSGVDVELLLVDEIGS